MLGACVAFKRARLDRNRRKRRESSGRATTKPDGLRYHYGWQYSSQPCVVRVPWREAYRNFAHAMRTNLAYAMRTNLAREQLPGLSAQYSNSGETSNM